MLCEQQSEELSVATAEDMDHVPDLLFVVDLEGRLCWWNQAFERISGLGPAELKHIEVTRFLPPERQVELQQRIAEVIEKGQAEMQAPLLTAEGFVPYRLKGTLMRNGAGRPLAIAGLGVDVRELERVNATQAEAQRIAHVGNWHWDVASGDISASREFFRIFGLPVTDTFTIEIIKPLIVAEDRQRVMRTLEGALQEARPYAIDYAILRPDGSRAVIHSEVEVRKDADGRAMELFGVTQDITAQHQAEISLRASESRWRSMAGAALDGVILIDERGRLIYWNQAAQEIFGYQGQNVLGKDLHELLAPRRYHAAYREGFAKFTRVGSGPVIGKRLELQARHRHGHEFPIELSLAAVAQDERWQAIGIVRDITERKQAEKALQRANRALRAITVCNESLVRAVDEQALLSQICEAIVDVGGYRLAWVGFPQQDEEKSFRIAAHAGDDRGYLQRLRVGWGDDVYGHGPAGEAFRRNAPYAVHDVGSDPAFRPWRELASEREMLSVVGLPLGSNGSSLGVLVIYAREVQVFDDQEMALLEQLANDLAYGIQERRTRHEHRKLATELDYLAHHDPLTGLLNRARLMQLTEDRLQEARQDFIGIALLFLDLDRFKLVNDHLGHAVGDDLLRQVAARLQGCLGQSDVVARTGGDEFVIQMTVRREPGCEGACAADRVRLRAASLAQHIQATMAGPFRVSGEEHYVEVSIGISCYPEHARTAAELYRNADSAMFAVKEKGRNGYAFFDQSLLSQQAQRFSLESRLHKAVENKEFILHYQPVVELSTGRIVAAEALIRWPQADGRLLPPAEFIPLAEELRLVIPLGEWVVGEVCRRLQAWRKDFPELRIAVNLSPIQARDEDAVGRLLAIVEQAVLSPGALEMEITETAMVSEPLVLEQALKRISAHGLEVALDDFGTGYSSMSRLKQLPVQTLKIDKSFVDGLPDDPNDASIVEAIINMGHGLGLRCLGEGIEIPEQWHSLLALGCELGQGYHFSRPLPAEAFEQLLRDPPHFAR